MLPVPRRLGHRVVGRRSAQRVSRSHQPAEEHLQTCHLQSRTRMFAIMMIMMMVMSATLPSWMRIRTRMMRRTRPSTVSRKRKAPCGGALQSVQGSVCDFKLWNNSSLKTFCLTSICGRNHLEIKIILASIKFPLRVIAAIACKSIKDISAFL